MSAIKYKQDIASILSIEPDQVFLYWKGRVALYAILKAMGIKEGDEIIIPAFTCVVVPNAILYLGAIPVYVEIDPETYNMAIEKLELAITIKTKVIICQNTFGLSSNIEKIIRLSKKHNLFTIEDCTHGFGGYYDGKPNGSYCDAAFYSTQWNKPFSTGIGGFLVVNKEALVDKVRKLNHEKVKSTYLDNIILAALLLFRRYFVNRFTYYSFIKIYRFLSDHNLIIGSSQGDEISDVEIPHNYFKDISFIQIKAGIRRLKKLENVNLLRKENALAYSQFLKAKNKTYVNEKFFDNHLFLKYPVIVKDRKLVFSLAQKAKITLGDWFTSPLYPVKGNLYPWKYDPNLYPLSVQISKKIMNLPTDVEDNSKVIRFLTDNIDLIE